MASGGAPEPLKCQTLVLRVSIHCESCNKKVKRILDRIDGVHHTDIDSRRNKVTVTASINAETLIKKLHKAGKHAELWPELKPLKTPNSPNPNPSNSNNKKKSTSSNPSENPEPKPPSSDSALVAPNTAASLAEKIESAAAKKPSETAQATETTSNPDTTTTNKADTEAPKRTNDKDSTNSETTDSAASTSTSPEKTTENKIERSTSSGKINRNKIHKDTSSVTGEENSMDLPNSTLPENPHTAQQPLPVVHAYNIVHPSASYAYFATTPIPQGYPPPEPYRYYRDYSEQPLPEFYHRTGSVEYSFMGGYYGPMDPEQISAPPEGHYDMFSDENANACKVM